jgi:hypothetical protein
MQSGFEFPIFHCFVGAEQPNTANTGGFGAGMGIQDIYDMDLEL